MKYIFNTVVRLLSVEGARSHVPDEFPRILSVFVVVGAVLG
jgi:hypothetical protein